MFTHCLVGFVIASTVAAGPAITKCKSEDSKCIKDSTNAMISTFAAGLPDLGVEPVDPLFFKELDASTPNLKLLLKDVTITGLQKCKAKKMVRDIPQSKLYVRLECNIQADGLYDMSGKLLFLPIEGNDKVHLTLNKIMINADVDLDFKEVDGKKYWNIKDYKYSYELKEKAKLNFENLFNGSDVLGRAAATMVQENGNEIIMEVGPPVIKNIAATIIDRVKVFFSKIPYDDMSLD